METGDLKFLLALEPKWTVSLNEKEFLPLKSSEIAIEGDQVHFGRYSRKITGIQWLRPDIVQIRGQAKFRSQTDIITLYPGERLPPAADIRRRRRAFQAEIGRALCGYFGVRSFQRQALYSDRRHGIGGAYPRFLAGRHACIAVDPDESNAVVNGIMRAALLWAPLVRRRVAVVVPAGRQRTISARLRVMPYLRDQFHWLEWDGSRVGEFSNSGDDPETHVQEFDLPDVQAEVARIRALAPELLQAVPHISGRAVSIRLRGIEIARVAKSETTLALGEPLENVIRDLAEVRRYGSRHPIARAHEERWLESNLIGQIRDVLPFIDDSHIYPQVPSFTGEERNIIDLLTTTKDGQLVVIEIKASADPDLPFQALDYWIAVEKHRKSGDLTKKGYFASRTLRDEPALLVLVAPLLAFHKTAGRLIGALPAELPLVEIGINQAWKRNIKVLRRRERSVRLRTEKSR